MGGCCPTGQKSESDSQTLNQGVPNSSDYKGNQEDRIELAFKTKRGNVYTSNALAGDGEDDQFTERMSFRTNISAKTTQQTRIIVTALSQNYMFASLNKEDLEELSSKMEIIDVAQGEDVITQGHRGEYFYIVETGNFTVFVDGNPVSTAGPGASFGELALLYNAPRQATVKADSDSTLFSLSRELYRFIIAQSSSSRSKEIKEALHNVPLLEGLTAEQLDKISDTVELFPYKQGDVIIKKGTEGRVFYMIKEGVCTVSELGDQFTEHSLQEGDYFGERALITGESRAATVTANSDKVLVMALDADSFKSLLGPLKDVLDQNMNLRALTSCKLFSRLTSAEKKKMAESFTLEKYAADTVIVKQGDKGNKFYILKDGAAKVLADGHEVGQLKAGTFFGEMALLDDEVRKATVTATVESECFVLERDVFIRILGSVQHIMNKETMSRLEILKKSAHDGGGQVEEEKEEEDPDIAFKDLRQIAMLGSGTFGRVSLVQDKNTKAVYALKVMQKAEIVAHKQQANVINEKKVMKVCKHPFILRLQQTYKDSKKLYMLLEFVQGGELFSVVHTAQGDGIPDAHAKFYGAGILLAIAYLHSKDIAYRDMKPENCLIDKEGYPKLVDFGFAKVITGKSFTLCGTPEYLAPELVLAKGHNKAVDYWALGILLYEMEAGYSPFSDPQGMDQVVICKNIVKTRLVFPRNFNADCKDLVKRLLSREISTRLGNLKGGCDDIKSQRWFQSIDFDLLTKRGIRAPWIPKVTGVTDTSNFDPYAPDEEGDNSHYVDRGDWDREF